jgi:hypothetical protein
MDASIAPASLRGASGPALTVRSRGAGEEAATGNRLRKRGIAAEGQHVGAKRAAGSDNIRQAPDAKLRLDGARALEEHRRPCLLQHLFLLGALVDGDGDGDAEFLEPHGLLVDYAKQAP